MKNAGILFLLGLLIAGCTDKKADIHQLAIQTVAKSDTLKALILQAESVSKSVVLPGELVPFERVNINAKVPAYIRQIRVDIGSVVKKGEVLVILEAPELQAKTAEAAAMAETVKAKMKSSNDIYQRNKEASAIPGAIAAAEVERSLNQFLTHKAEYEAAQRYVGSMKEIQNYLTIRSPFDGVIVDRKKDVGSLTGSGGEPILILENNQSLRLRVSVPEALTGLVLQDKTVTFNLKAEPTQTFSALLARKSESIDPSTRSEIWEFKVPNGNKKIKSGMFASVTLNFSRQHQSVTVPYSAITTSLERKFIIKISDGIVQWIDIQQGLTLSDKVEIFGNFSPGDTILSKSSEEIKPETKVMVKL